MMDCRPSMCKASRIVNHFLDWDWQSTVVLSTKILMVIRRGAVNLCCLFISGTLLRKMSGPSSQDKYGGGLIIY